MFQYGNYNSLSNYIYSAISIIFMGVSFMLVWTNKFYGGRIEILKLLFNNQSIKIITNTVRRHAERFGFICCLLEKSASENPGVC